MNDTRQTTRPAGARLTRRALLEGGVALGLAAATSHVGPLDVSPRAQAMQGAGREDWGAFDRALQAATQTFGIVGAAVAVVNTAGLVHQRTLGVRDLASGAPVTPGTVFRAASMTKSMAALLVAQFVDEGLLDWDQPVREIWPAFRAPTQELTAALRVRDLLGMASGLGAREITDLQQGHFNARQVLESVAWLPVLGPPGTVYHYNNTLVAVAGYLPALALGAAPEELLTAYARQMRERVYEPVGMTTARIADDPRPFGDDYATGYGPDFAAGPAVEPWGPDGSFAPAGGTLASLTDMAAYVTLQLRGGTTPAGRRVVSAQNLAECWQPVIAAPIERSVSSAVSDGAYCLGWMSTRFAGRRVISHGGVLDGFIGNMVFFPDDGVGLVVLTNTFPGGSALGVYATNLLLEQRFGLAASTNAAFVAEYQAAIGEQAARAAQAVPVEPAAIAPYLGYYEGGFRLAFDAESALRLHLPPRAWRVLGQPDGSYVIGSGVPAGTPLSLSRDAVGIPLLDLQEFGTVRWQSGLD